jgi:hypothetical protein
VWAKTSACVPEQHTLLAQNAAAATVLFCGLEDERDRLRADGQAREDCGSAEQHCCVTIVTTGVHDTIRAACIRRAGGFVDRERIDISAERDGRKFRGGGGGGGQMSDNAGAFGESGLEGNIQ